MTREAAIKYSLKLEETLYPFDKKSLKMIVDKIYDDFENQKCNNCIFLICDEDGNFSQCSILDEISVSYNFGCNKWKAK